MIVVRYTGGLGNQMFEYAMSLMLEEKFPKEEIYADLSRYDLTREHNGFELEKYFEVCVERVSGECLRQIAPIHYFLNKIRLKSFLRKCSVSKTEKINDYLERKISKVGVIKDLDSTNYNENAFELNTDSVTLWHYKGNWINPLYWKGYEDIIIRKFQFKKNLLNEQDKEILRKMEEYESVAVHIRRGDYVGDYCFDLCDMKYYLSAAAYIESNLEGKELHYFIFSDGNFVETFCGKDNISNICHPKNSGIDLYLMSKCKHNIIANSTFSYWAALLNESTDKIVIAPKYAYREKATLRKLPVPEEWKVIDNIV